MSLRVLLADESLNIKKNMQMSLQDFGIEVKSLLNGDEVITVTKSFKPDIIFLDILLAKINGYDVCSQLKNHPDFRHIPVILSRSSFIDIDETKFRQCRAEGRLEKPFDKQTLRKLVQHFVPKTKSQGLSEFLTLPELRNQDAQNQESQQESVYNKTLSHFIPRESALVDFKIDDEPDEFRPGPSPFQSTVPEISPLTTQNDEPEEWVPRPLVSSSHPTKPAVTQAGSNFNSPATAMNMEENYEVEIADIKLPPEPEIPTGPELDTLPLMGRSRRSSIKTPSQYSGPPPQIQLDQKQLDELVKAQLRPLLLEIINQVLPDLAEKIIREEIDKLMRSTEQEL